MTISKQQITYYLVPLLIYAALISVWGYTIGHGNSIQLTPYLLYLNDTDLYSNDFFIQNATKNLPNERSFFIWFLQPFAGFLEWPLFILHAIFTIALIVALVKIAQHFLKNYWWSVAAVLLLLFPFLYHTIGLNEMYAGEFNSNFVADTFVAWAIWWMLQQKVYRTYIAIILATLMHPLAGLHSFLLVSGVFLFQALYEKKYAAIYKTYLLPVLLYLATAGVFIVYLQLRLSDAEWDEASFFQAFVVFRNAHHYIPTAFSKSDILMLTPLMLLVPLVFYKRSLPIFIFSIIIITGCIAYCAIVLNINSGTVATAQWFKTTIWLEWFGVISLLLVLQVLFEKFKWLLLQKWMPALVLLFSIAWVLFVFPTPKIMQEQITYEFPFYKKYTPEIDIAEQALQVTDKDALFITPCSVDELKYYGRRSAVVDYKALTHSKSFIRDWTSRFNDVYSVDPLTSKVISFDAMRLADEHYRQLNTEKVSELQKKYGITHILMYNTTSLPYKTVAANEVYTIYEL
jgi:hypothetical protein